MKGEEDFAKAMELKAKRIDGSPGSLYGVAPWKRMVIAFAGPFFNLVSAMLLFFVINIGGYTIETTDNRIILASEFTGETDMPADKVGLRTGDRIVAVNGEKTEYFYQILEAAALNADKELTLTVDRRGDLLTVRVTPQLNPQTGGGVIGVYSFQPPEVAEVRTGSPAFEAGLRPGDVITAVDDHPVAHSIELQQALLDTVGGRTQLTVVRVLERSPSRAPDPLGALRSGVLAAIDPRRSPARALIASGMRIGRSVVGTMTTTLLLAYSGGYITLLMMFCAQGNPPWEFINNPLVASEAVKTLIGSFSLLLVAPFTALFAGILLCRARQNTAEAPAAPERFPETSQDPSPAGDAEVPQSEGE